MDRGKVLFLNGKIFRLSKTQTGLKEAAFHSCLLVQDGTVKHVGSEDDEPVRAAKAASAAVHDLGGRHRAPRLR